MTEDLELKQYRDMMPPPDRWEDGFGIKAMIGGLFVGFIMTPASMYMGLVQGADIGAAAQWVTVILFIEVARRSFTQLSRPEIYVLYYMAGASLVSGAGLLGNQFLVQSEAMRQFGLADKIPIWVAPGSLDVLGQRTFFHRAWLLPIGLMALGQVVQRLDHFGLGYVMFRLTSDVEKLPFPMAPIGVAGITALADASGGLETRRWRVFSFGAVLGMLFAIIYTALPAVSGAFLPEPIQLLPLPFKDLTANTQTFLPAVPVMLSFNIGLILVGMVLPFWAMIGGFIGLIVTMIANVLMYKHHVLKLWSPDIGALATLNTNYLDFYLSWGLGLTGAIAAIGFWSVFRHMTQRKKQLDGSAAAKVDWGALFRPPAGRGDVSIWLAIGIYIFSTTVTISTAYIMLQSAHRADPINSAVSKTLMAVLIFYGFVYTPILSYVSARMEGIIGMSVAIPYVREATFILTGYKGAAIWFAPFPIYNYGEQTRYFRTTELTGTKIWSMVKAEAFILPIVLISTVVFSEFIWRIAPVPSAAFQYAQQYWEFGAYRTAVMIGSTMPGGEHGPFFEAFKPMYIYLGLGVGLLLYMGLSAFGMPIFLFYGIVRGLDQSTPDVILPQFIGALLGRYYFQKRFGDNWLKYIVVFAAGFGCGMGLVMMLSLGLVFMSKSVFTSTF